MMNTKINSKNIKVYKPNTSNTQHSREHGYSKAISKKSKPNGNITYDNTITNAFSYLCCLSYSIANRSYAGTLLDK